jgi:prepilin-type N-terminal cleavage/methylation domain-containing protein
MAPKKRQQGFTLIEVSLAIVIGVIILAGAITLYNQSKLSAGNSKANEKALSLASLTEEMAANNNGTYPTLANLQTQFLVRRQDAGLSPYGGTLTTAISPMFQTNNTTAMTDANFAATPSSIPAPGWTTTQAASAGQAFYYATANPVQGTFYDTVAGNTKQVNNFLVGVCTNTGAGPAFVVGGR